MPSIAGKPAPAGFSVVHILCVHPEPCGSWLASDGARSNTARLKAVSNGMYIRWVAWLAPGSRKRSVAAIRAFTCMVISLTVKENRECLIDGGSPFWQVARLPA